MTLSNPWFLLALIGLIGLFHIELLADFLNLSRLPRADDAAGKKNDEAATERERLIEYNTQSTKAGIVRSAVSLGLLIAFWICGGFGWLDQWTRTFGLDEVLTSVLLIGVLGAAQSVFSLPFEVWETFGIEGRFGFNRTTIGTFIADRFKGLVLSALIGLPIIWLVVWFFATQQLAALYAWLSIIVISVIMSWLAPRFIMPLFLKFEPLKDGSLRDRIFALAEKLKFPVAEVSVADGSRRSTKANAFFAGFGKTKRIALFDTLIDGHSEDEIIAVLAHEIGHFKRRHIIRQMIAGFVQMGALFLLLHFALHSRGLHQAFGVAVPSIGMGLVLFSIVYRPISTLMEILQLAMSRRFEFEADEFAAHAVGSTSPLASALGKLSREHLSHPSPHPFYVGLHYSHPPTDDRLRALAALHLQPV